MEIQAALRELEALADTLDENLTVPDAFIQALTSHPHSFFFSSFLNHQKLAKMSTLACDTLKLFAYGTFNDFNENPTRYLLLSSEQLHKLRQLTLLTYCQAVEMAAYDDLMSVLHVDSMVILEEMVVECMELELVTGKLNQRLKQLHVVSCVARDLSPHQLSHLSEHLSLWSQRIDSLLKELDSEVETARAKSLQFDKEIELFDASPVIKWDPSVTSLSVNSSPTTTHAAHAPTTAHPAKPRSRNVKSRH